MRDTRIELVISGHFATNLHGNQMLCHLTNRAQLYYLESSFKPFSYRSAPGRI